jgi:hypothetical protein
MEAECSILVPVGRVSVQSLKNRVAIIIGTVIAYQIATLGRQGLWYDERKRQPLVDVYLEDSAKRSKSPDLRGTDE